MNEGRRIEVRGTIQGVGFRPFIVRLARSLGVTGRVRNGASGVIIEAFGGRASIEALISALRLGKDAPRAIEVTDVRVERIEVRDDLPDRFEIDESDASGERQITFPADLATCDACLSEVRDPRDRRYRHAFTSCTACGPRYTIVRSLPYDRAATAMAPFPMCDRCRAELDDVTDRRFHAQPNACPACGPRLSLLDGEGRPLAGAVSEAAAALVRGEIVAVKGIGGFHLACDAGSALAVSRLRERKRREAKPLAVMVRDLEAAERLAALTDAERALLSSVERPIVLARRKEDASIAPEVAPDSPWIGLLLAYSPLHDLLLDEVMRPLVMTSGNLSEEPIARTEAEAIERLRGIADRFVVHDREIVSRIDDSVARVIGGAPVILRRARGYVPHPIRVARPFARPVFAAGAQLKNTFCVGVASEAILGPHIGDLDDPDTLASFEESAERILGLLEVEPEVFAHDLHPDFLSTRWAIERAARSPGGRTVPVQHHHAHVAAVMAEHGLEPPVLGLSWDGAGHGADGASWGGELLLASYEGFERLATLRPIALAGGDRAIREVWRIALALIDDAFEGFEAPSLERLALFEDASASIPRAKIDGVRQVIRRGLAARSHGVGRLFDGAGALLFARAESRFEGEIAARVNHAAEAVSSTAAPYPFDVLRSQIPRQIDLREAIRRMVGDLLSGIAAPLIAARFHATLIAAGSAVVRAAARDHGRLPVVLSGGCLQNPILAEGLIAALSPEHEVHLARRVPPGDGGIALGQAVIADAIARRG